MLLAASCSLRVNKQPATREPQLRHRDLNKLRLLVAEGKEIAAEAELDRIAERSAANDFDGRAVAEAHLEEPAAQFGVAPDRDDASAATYAQTVQRAGLRRTAVITTA